MNSQDRKPAEPKRTRVDTGEQNPWELAKLIYSDNFLTEFQKKFGFDAVSSSTATQLRNIVRRYIIVRRWENQPELLKNTRRKYIALQKATERYLAVLETYNESEIGSDMKTASQILNWPASGLASSEDYFLQLNFLLELLKTATAQQAQYLRQRGGRHMNFGLEDLIRLAAEFWTEGLKRPFTIDYHKGAGLTPAFAFIKSLVAPLDDVPDTQIVTAMRTEIKKRNSSGQKIPNFSAPKPNALK